MKVFLAVSISMMAFSGLALADVNSAKQEANKKIEQSRNALDATKVCVTKATTEAAITRCRVDLFPTTTNEQRMEEDKKGEGSSKDEASEAGY